MTLPVDYENATVSLDTHPDAHNATNVAVNDLDTRVSDIEAAGGAVILTGAGTPATGVGTAGDYYLDTTNHVLYGPKAAGTAPADQEITVSGTPTTGSGVSLELGMKLLFDVAGTVSRVRYQRHASSIADMHVKAWNVTTTTQIATVSDSRAGQSGWFEVTFPAPVTIAAGQIVMFSYGGLAPMYHAPAPTITNTADVNWQTTWSTSPTGGYPTGADTVAVWVQPIFEPTWAPWPVAVYGIPAGGTTNQFLKKTSGTDYAVAWVT